MVKVREISFIKTKHFTWTAASWKRRSHFDERLRQSWGRSVYATRTWTTGDYQNTVTLVCDPGKPLRHCVNDNSREKVDSFLFKLFVFFLHFCGDWTWKLAVATLQLSVVGSKTAGGNNKPQTTVRWTCPGRKKTTTSTFQAHLSHLETNYEKLIWPERQHVLPQKDTVPLIVCSYNSSFNYSM